MAEIKTTYTEYETGVEHEFTIRNFLSYEEVEHIIHETYKAAFDDDGEYDPFRSNAMLNALLLNMCTDIDKELIGTVQEAYKLACATNVAEVVWDYCTMMGKTIRANVDKMIDAKLKENPLKSVGTLLRTMANGFSGLDYEQLLTDALANENVKQKVAKLKN